MSLFQIVLPEIILVTAACVLFLVGFAGPKATGRLSASIALVALFLALLAALRPLREESLGAKVFSDTYQSFRLSGFGVFVRIVALAMAIPLTLLSSPSGRDASGNPSVHWGRDSGEYFGLLLLSFTGLIMVPMCNDLIVLFMAIELASIPTYILVSISRPLATAQEAGVKYFFLGALAAAILLMGLAYLYGTTGTTNMHQIGAQFAALKTGAGAPALSAWQLMAGVIVIVGLSFKLAAVPLHAYAADVYEGAATAVTAVLGFVPKAVGIIALVKILFLLAGNDASWQVSPQVTKLIWVLAVLTMTVGNLLALTQRNIKRLFAYSSVAHSGYLLAGVAFMLLLGADDPRQRDALASVLFYLVVYGITSTAVFGALMLIPSRKRIEIGSSTYLLPATTAETTDDLAGFGRSHPVIAAMLAVGCFSLIGLPFTGGFWGKYYLLVPALAGYGHVTSGGGWLLWLAILLVVNSGLSAAYYLGVVGALFNRKPVDEPLARPAYAPGTLVAVAASVLLVLVLGILLQSTQLLSSGALVAADSMDGPLAGTPVALGE